MSEMLGLEKKKTTAKEFEMIETDSKRSFMYQLNKLGASGWEPIWETFMAEPQSLVGTNTGKTNYTIILQRG